MGLYVTLRLQENIEIKLDVAGFGQWNHSTGNNKCSRASYCILEA